MKLLYALLILTAQCAEGRSDASTENDHPESPHTSNLRGLSPPGNGNAPHFASIAGEMVSACEGYYFTPHISV